MSLALLTLVGAVFGDVTKLVAEITIFVVICRCHHCRLHCLHRVFADNVIRGQMVSDVIHEPCDAISECGLRLTRLHVVRGLLVTKGVVYTSKVSRGMFFVCSFLLSLVN